LAISINMNEISNKDKIGDIIEELKRLQIEHNNLKVRKLDSNNQLKTTWPQVKEINNEIFVVF
jgi:cell fate (sporulation/competence/biofilm development) regulator YmcA (YheA/YmcA/DUF963 family)